jgi:cysteinyl-tRNA synthetase
MYVCGVTPYDKCHLGHARCYVTFDFIRRALTRLGYAVTHVQNFTDIDDKIIARARERGVEPGSLAESYIADYFSTMDRLNVRRADQYPRVTGHIPQIIAFIERLAAEGLAYAVDGGVYYAVRKFPPYGRLSKRSLDDLVAGARVDVDDRKNDPLDFALWKAAKPGEPAWPSPWGPGRPGWHIECSVMSTGALGDTFDIHGGGLDLIFPHHENEIAQTEGATRKPFARYWIHNGFVTVNHEKMSKSLGNFFTLDEIFNVFDPRAVRYLLLTEHYRTPLEFSDDLLRQAEARLKAVETDLQRLNAVVEAQHGTDGQDRKVLEDAVSRFQEGVTRALEDGFNAPKVVAVIHDLLGELTRHTATHRALHTGALRRGMEAVQEAFRDVLGIELRTAADDGGAEIRTLVELRARARQEKNWAEADRLRGELTARGFVVEDTPQGPRWWRNS